MLRANIAVLLRAIIYGPSRRGKDNAISLALIRRSFSRESVVRSARIPLETEIRRIITAEHILELGFLVLNKVGV